ncbi:MAG: Bcr/CflA family drug resistance efflux transporter, partial [Actinomycetes bacterium]
AGTATALLGSTGFLLGGLLAPLASARGTSAIAMMSGIVIARAGAWLAYAMVARGERDQQALTHEHSTPSGP